MDLPGEDGRTNYQVLTNIRGWEMELLARDRLQSRRQLESEQMQKATAAADSAVLPGYVRHISTATRTTSIRAAILPSGFENPRDLAIERK